MGGDVDKSHGVGLTSGLTRNVPPQRGPMAQGFRTGGHVVPQRVGYQPANHPHRQGNREGHMGLLGGAASALSWGIPGLIQAGKMAAKHGLKKWSQYGTKNLKNIAAAQDEALAGAKAIGIGTKATYKSLKGVKEGTKKWKAIKAFNEKVKARNILMNNASFGNAAKALNLKASGIMGQAGRGAWALAGPATAATAIGASAAGPEWYQREISDEDSRLQKALKYAGKGYVDYSLPGAAATGIDWLTGDQDPRGLSNIISGITPAQAEEVAEITHDTEPMEISSKMEQQEALRQQYLDKIELYKELLGADTDQNNLGTLSDALMQAGTALTEGEGWTGAMSAGYDPLAAENIRRRDRKSGVHEAAVTQAFSDIAGSQSMIDQANIEAVAQGETDLPFKLKAQTDAHAAGIGTINHMLDDDGEIDTEKLSETPGMIYFDVDKVAGGGYYVAVNMDGEARSFNSIEDAEAFMNSRTT
jgi:hypothetical protein